LFADEVGNGARPLDRTSGGALRLRCGSHEPVGDEPIEHSLGADGEHAGDGTPAVGDDDLLAPRTRSRYRLRLFRSSLTPTWINVAPLHM
jgi:hypothetical protein